MNIDYLRTFLTLAENGSFSETAKEHIVVQSTVSSRIQELEKELGQSLFIRSYNHAELTLAGQAFLEYAKNIVELENRAIDRIGLVGQFSERADSRNGLCFPQVLSGARNQTFFGKA